MRGVADAFSADVRASHGISEFQTHHEVATNVINLMEGALEQAREAARVDKDIQDLIRQATATNNTQNL